MRLTEEICLGVFGLEVENVDTEANALKEGVVLDCLREVTIVVIEDMVWLDVSAKHALDHFLWQDIHY
jgi:hypothetical protein